MDEYTNSRYDMILTVPGLDHKFSEKVMTGGKGPYEDFSAPMAGVRNYNVVSITDKQFNLNNPLLTHTLTYASNQTGQQVPHAGCVEL